MTQIKNKSVRSGRQEMKQAQQNPNKSYILGSPTILPPFLPWTPPITYSNKQIKYQLSITIYSPTWSFPQTKVSGLVHPITGPCPLGPSACFPSPAPPATDSPRSRLVQHLDTIVPGKYDFIHVPHQQTGLLVPKGGCSLGEGHCQVWKTSWCWSKRCHEVIFFVGPESWVVEFWRFSVFWVLWWVFVFFGWEAG